MKRWLAPVAVVLLGAGLSGVLDSPATAADAGNEAQVLAFVNSQRAGASLVPLSTNSVLESVARSWTDVMVATGLGHNPALASLVPGGWSAIGENVGEGPTVASIEQAWLGSAPHRANILGSYDAIGIGVSWRPDGMAFATIDFLKWQPGLAPVATFTGSGLSPAGVGSAGAAGYYVLGSDGGVFSYGRAPFFGSVPGLGVRAQAVLMSVTPSQAGYWVLGTDGGVFSFGDARFFGSLPGLGVKAAGVDLKPTPDGKGYWVMDGSGGVYGFGDAPYLGSLPGLGVHTQAVKLAPTPSGRGYWILGADGGVFSFGDASFFGSLPGLGVQNASVSLAPTPSGRGYWILGADGGVFSFGDASFHGSVPGLRISATGVQLVSSADGAGYYVLSSDGRVFNFGDAPSYGQPAAYRVTTLDLGIVAH